MNFFDSVDDVIDHENEGECDQCGKWLGCENNMQIHKQKEHKIINKKVNKESQKTSNIIIAEKNEFIKCAPKILEVESENPERDKIIIKHDKNKNTENNKENQETFTTQKLENSKKG